jgi:hypothetical protein
MLDHMNDRRSSARKHALSATASVDSVDQPRLDPDVDIAVFRFMPVSESLPKVVSDATFSSGPAVRLGSAINLLAGFIKRAGGEWTISGASSRPCAGIVCPFC